MELKGKPWFWVPPPSFWRVLNRFMVLMFRLGLGPVMDTGRIMVLGTTGRKSGRVRRSPLNFARGIGDVFCVAGYGPKSDWFRNLRRQPRVEIWMGSETWAGTADLVTEPGARLKRLREVLIASGFASRWLAGIDAHKIPDDELASQAADYQVVRVALTERSPRGHADLVWVWPVLAGLVALAAFR